MGEITLNREDSMRILNNPEADQGVRAIAACAVAFFESKDAAEGMDAKTRSITHKLLRMASSALDEEP